HVGAAFLGNRGVFGDVDAVGDRDIGTCAAVVVCFGVIVGVRGVVCRCHCFGDIHQRPQAARLIRRMALLFTQLVCLFLGDDADSVALALREILGIGSRDAHALTLVIVL